MAEEIKMTDIHTIAIIGGTGKEGQGLAYRWAKAGYQVIIGSRKEEKAQEAVEALKEMLDDNSVVPTGMANEMAVGAADIAVLTVPFNFHRSVIESLKEQLMGKILIDVTVPLVPPKVSMVQMPEEGSAAMQAQAILGENSVVVAAFQNISFENLLSEERPACDILVCGEKKAAREAVLQLIADADLIGWDAGYLENSVVVEGMTSILIGLNKKYGTKSAGIQITGIER